MRINEIIAKQKYIDNRYCTTISKSFLISFTGVIWLLILSIIELITSLTTSFDRSWKARRLRFDISINLHKARICYSDIYKQSPLYRVSCLRYCGFFYFTPGKFYLFSRIESFKRYYLSILLPIIRWKIKLYISLRAFNIVFNLDII